VSSVRAGKPVCIENAQGRIGFYGIVTTKDVFKCSEITTLSVEGRPLRVGMRGVGINCLPNPYSDATSYLSTTIENVSAVSNFAVSKLVSTTTRGAASTAELLPTFSTANILTGYCIGASSCTTAANNSQNGDFNGIKERPEFGIGVYRVDVTLPDIGRQGMMRIAVNEIAETSNLGSERWFDVDLRTQQSAEFLVVDLKEDYQPYASTSIDRAGHYHGKRSCYCYSTTYSDTVSDIMGAGSGSTSASPPLPKAIVEIHDVPDGCSVSVTRTMNWVKPCGFNDGARPWLLGLARLSRDELLTFWQAYILVPKTGDLVADLRRTDDFMSTLQKPIPQRNIPILGRPVKTKAPRRAKRPSLRTELDY
jgi:hypothetical protein